MVNWLMAGKAGVKWMIVVLFVDKQMRTNVPYLRNWDIVGQPMSHKGVHEGHVAAEVIAGQKHYFDLKWSINRLYWTRSWGKVKPEKECKQEGLNYKVLRSLKAAVVLLLWDVQKVTKLIFDKDTHRNLVVIVGSNVANY